MFYKRLNEGQMQYRIKNLLEGAGIPDIIQMVMAIIEGLIASVPHKEALRSVFVKAIQGTLHTEEKKEELVEVQCDLCKSKFKTTKALADVGARVCSNHSINEEQSKFYN